VSPPPTGTLPATGSTATAASAAALVLVVAGSVLVGVVARRNATARSRP
jgi:LPXTG-motif cell wall-anchored protein